MGLTIYVARPHGDADCTNGGLSARFDRLTVVNVDGPSEPKPDAPAVRLELNRDKASVRLVPVTPEGESAPWYQMGGNYGATSDSRFSEACAAILGHRFYGAVAIHDRREDPEAVAARDAWRADLARAAEDARTFPPFPAFIGRGPEISSTPLCAVEFERRGVIYVASVFMDDAQQAPDKRQDGFWPSLKPESDGFIGDGKTRADLSAAKRKAESIMQRYADGSLFYVGIAVQAFSRDPSPRDPFGRFALTAEFDNALWGIECNWPDETKPANEYLREAACEILRELPDQADLEILAAKCQAAIAPAKESV